MYAIEQLKTIEVARTLASANGFADRITFIEEASSSSAPSFLEKADVLVTETLWNFGLGEGIVGFVIDGRERFLRAGGSVIPQTVDMIVAPVEAPGLHTRTSPQHATAWHGLDHVAVPRLCGE